MNVLLFYEMYHEGSVQGEGEKSNNPLDQWILARLAELGSEMTRSLDAYELDRAVKPIGLFVDDLSTWYIRRSRDRFKSDDVADRAHAIATTRTVLRKFSKLLAPVMPFLAEHLYGHVDGSKESVHLETWPTFAEPDEQILTAMAEVRNIVSLALEARAKAGIKVRQPLASVTIRGTELDAPLVSVIADELNIKKVVFTSAAEHEVSLDTIITPELRREGQFRELVRTVQELRKKTGLTPSDVVTLEVTTSDEGRALVEEFSVELRKTSLIKEILFKDITGEVMNIDGTSFTLAFEK
jgi:isoleucyl-tRNA synthetase